MTGAVLAYNLGYMPNDYHEKLVQLIGDDGANFQTESFGSVEEVAKESVPNLISLFKDDDYQKRSKIAFVLTIIGRIGKDGQEFIQDISSLLQMTESFISVISDTIQREDSWEAVPDLILSLRDDRPRTRSHAAMALASVGKAAKEAVPDLILSLRDENSAVRSSAAVALGGIGESAKKSIPDLILLLQDNKSHVRFSAAFALGCIGESAKKSVPDLILLLQDDKSYVRFIAAQALGEIGEAAKESLPELILLLKDEDWEVRYSAAQALDVFRVVKFLSILQMLNVIYGSDRDTLDVRWLAYYLSDADPDNLNAIHWLGNPKEYPEVDKLSHEEQVSILNTFEKAWQNSEGLTQLRRDLARQTAIIIDESKWKAKDIMLLQKHYQYLKQANSRQAYAVQEKIRNLEFWQWVFRLWKIWLAHFTFWIVLIFAYPKSPAIQAIFFWNPWVRNIAGVGYVGFLLTWVPFLRAKLFKPFKISLLADADLLSFRAQAYYDKSNVEQLATHKIQAINQAIPELKGQIILQGESGLGKSQFLRHLTKKFSRLMVFLPADRCTDGVIPAIQRKLHGDIATDQNFLRNLIYSGALDICIDGLNEVSADTRAEIRDFVERNFKGNIILTTQPLEWRAPSTSITYVLQPLTREQITDFLLNHKTFIATDALITGEDYENACRTYLAQTLHPDQSTEELRAARQVLSNPMDLTLVAQMIADHKRPDLFNLQEQQYQLMAQDYQQQYLDEFPLALFSEAVYEMRLNDQRVIPENQFFEELRCMERFKMVVSQQLKDEEGNAIKEWKFRHDKIMEFFIVQTFLKHPERPEQYLDDPRFRGVYLLLAFLLPLEDAKLLREVLIDYAVDSKDHHVSDLFIQRLRSRQVSNLANQS